MAVYDEDSKDLLRGVIQSPHSNCCYDIKLNTGEIKSVEDIWVMVRKQHIWLTGLFDI
jgi:hypothetical protein